MAGTDECPEEIEISCVSVGHQDVEGHKSLMPRPAVALKVKKKMDKRVAADMGVRLDIAEKRDMKTIKMLV